LELAGVITLIYFAMNYARTVYRIKPDNKVVFISGCDSGFGNGAAKELSKIGFNVIAGCYTQDGVSSFKGVNNVTAIHLDITSEKSIEDAFEIVKKQCPNGLWALINNAGITNGFSIDFTTMEIYRRVMDVNFFGHVTITKKFLPLIKKAKGRIVNMGSVAGRLSSATLSAYSAAKFALVGWNDSLREDMNKFGIRVIIVEAGFMKTPLVTREAERTISQCFLSTPKEILEEYGGENYKEKILQRIVKTSIYMADDPKIVVDTYVNACVSAIPKSRYLVGSGSWILSGLSYMPIWFIDWLLDKVRQRTLKL